MLNLTQNFYMAVYDAPDWDIFEFWIDIGIIFSQSQRTKVNQI